MSLSKLASKYIVSTEQAFSEMEITQVPIKIGCNDAKKVVEFAKAYLEDAKYYMDKKKFEVSLASIAYCEGLLDALRMLGAVKFEWSTRKEEKKGEK